MRGITQRDAAQRETQEPEADKDTGYRGATYPAALMSWARMIPHVLYGY